MMIPDAWKNSQKSAVVGGGDGELIVRLDGDWMHVDDAGLSDDVGVLISTYLKFVHHVQLFPELGW